MYNKAIPSVLALILSTIALGQEKKLNKAPLPSEGLSGNMKWVILEKARTEELQGMIVPAKTEHFKVQVIPEGVDFRGLKENDNKQKSSFTTRGISGLRRITTIMEEDFEGVFPTGHWEVFDADGAFHGEYYWGKDTYKPHFGNYSAWCAKYGANGIDPTSGYPNYCNSWMIYGPFDLSDSTINVAELNFSFWLDSEVGHDYFYWGTSINGMDFYSKGVSGTTYDQWWYESLDLTNVPILGDLTGNSSVWIAFIFQSDASTTQKGIFIDDVVLLKGQVESPITFTDVGSSAAVDHVHGGRGVGWGDVNNDGYLDLYNANKHNPNLLYLNSGSGSFVDIAASAGVEGNLKDHGVAWGDFDNDGDIDLFVTNDGGGPTKLYRNSGNNTFTDISSSAGVEDFDGGISAAWADYDRDGYLDLYVTKWGKPNRLYHNNGDNTFADVASSTGVADAQGGTGLAWGDFDNDGDSDLYVVNWGQPNRLYRNNGNNTFTDIASQAGVADAGGGRGVDWGDFDNDGDLDLYLVTEYEQPRLYRNNGDNTFTDIASGAGVLGGGRGNCMAWGDFDNDGFMDLYLGNSGNASDEFQGQANRLYHNNGNSTFTDVAPAVGLDDTARTEGVSWGDFDNDGDLDLYVSNAHLPNRLFRNNGSSNNWLVLNLVGTVSNKSGIGARVRTVVGAGSQIREISGGGYYSQNSLPIEFGFGQATIVDSLIIYWPSGIKQVLINTIPNQIIEIQEDTTSVNLVSFTDIGSSSGMAQAGDGRGIAWGDFDNDDDLDLYLANVDELNCLFRNNGNNTFTNIASSANVEGNLKDHGVAWGDFDNDGDIDLFVTNDGGGPTKLYRNSGNNTFTDISSSAGVEDFDGGISAAWADYDRDGYLDLYVTKWGKPNRLYHNNGDNTFADVASSTGVADAQGGTGLAWGDFDNDGDSDLYVVNWGQPNRLYRNNGNNTFTDIASQAGVADAGGGRGVDWGDFDNDGDLDLYLVTEYEQPRLYRNNGDNTFTDIASGAGVLGGGRGNCMAWGDFDNDGFMDLYLGNSGNASDEFQGQANRLYHNNGNSTFTDVAPAVGLDDTARTEGVSWGDFDNDGDLDLYVSNAHLPNRLFRNNGSSNNWLVLNLVGTVSNKSGIGARVRTVVGAGSQIREISGGGYYSQNSLPIEFGFGQATIVDSLIIYWPSGIVQDTVNVSVNQFIKVIESQRFTGIEEIVNNIPDDFRLFQNYPNPFNASTIITFTLPNTTFVNLKIYNLIGNEIETLVSGQRVAGKYQVEWKAEREPSGIYLYRLDTGEFVKTKKLILQK